MPKLTLEDLKKIKESHTASSTLREGGCRAKITSGSIHGLRQGGHARHSQKDDAIHSSRNCFRNVHFGIDIVIEIGVEHVGIALVFD